MGPVHELLKGNRFLVHIPGIAPILANSTFDAQEASLTTGSMTITNQMANMQQPTIDQRDANSETVLSAQKKEKVRRPANAWILYRTHMSAELRQQRPYLTNNEVSQILSAQWHSEPFQVRNHWKGVAAQVKERHRELHPNYTYQPRRPDQIRRRRRNNTVAVAQTDNDTDTIPSTPSSTVLDADFFIGSSNDGDNTSLMSDTSIQLSSLLSNTETESSSPDM